MVSHRQSAGRVFDPIHAGELGVIDLVDPPYGHDTMN